MDKQKEKIERVANKERDGKILREKKKEKQRSYTTYIEEDATRLASH